MEGSWRFDHDGWTEIWHRAADGGFDRVSVGNRVYALGRDDIAVLRPRSADGCTVCRRMLPRGFAYCPVCGATLSDIAYPTDPCQSVPNASRPEAGLPPLALAEGGSRHEPVPLPQAGRHFAFAVAGTPSRLFALDRDGGWLHEFDHERSGWTRLAGLGEITLPNRSWSMAASPAGLVIASAGRLSVIDLASGPVPRLVAAALGERDVCLGAPCCLGDEALALIVRGGALHLARRRMVRGGEWSFEAVQNVAALPATSDPMQEAFSAPMTAETRVSWAGRDGTVVVSLGDDGRVAGAFWRRWSQGFEPYLEHRPYVDPDGLVWQLGSMPIAGNKRGMGFERIRLHGQFDQERIGGSVLTYGILACRLLTLRHRAWEERSPYDRLLPGKDGDFLVPVLALDRQRCVLISAAEGLGELVHAGPDGLASPVLAGWRFYDGWVLHDLGLSAGLRLLSQGSAFVFAGSLYAYDAQENECWRWRMQAAG